MAFEAENKLEQSLMKAADDPSYRPQFYRDLVESDLFIVLPGPPPERTGKVTLQPGHQLTVQNIESGGKLHIPVFSSLRRLRESIQQESAYIAINALELMRLTQGAEMLLNPWSDYGKELTKKEIQSIMDGSIWQPSESYQVEKDTQVMIGQPGNYPHELVDSLCRLFRRTREVRRAYVAHFHNPDKDEKPHTLIGIEVSGKYREVVAQAGLVVDGVKVPDPPVDFMEIAGRGGVEDYFLKECEPFYTRKVMGLF